MGQNSVYDLMTNAEREVAELLKEMGIKWTYEHPVFVWDNSKRPRVMAPDFYLVHFGIYVEVCGSEKFHYCYRNKIFNKNGYKIIYLHLYKKSNKWQQHPMKYLKIFVITRNKELAKIIKNSNLKFIISKKEFDS